MKRAQLIPFLAFSPFFFLAGSGISALGLAGCSAKDDQKKDQQDNTSTGEQDTQESEAPDGQSSDGDVTAQESSSEKSTGQEPEPEPEGEALTPKTYCQAFATVICKGDADCCKDSSKQFEDPNTCKTEMVARCTKDMLVLIEDERTGFDGAVARTELDRLDALTKSCDLKAAAWFVERRSGMMKMYQGTVESGDECKPKDSKDAGAMLSCKKGVCAIKAFPLLSGSCQDQGIAKDAACYAHVECEDGLYCTAPEGLAGQCKERLEAGKDCSDGFGCDSFYCENSKCVEATADRVFCAK